MSLTSEQVSVLRQVTCMITCQADEGANAQVDAALQTLVDAMGAAAAVILWHNGDRLALRSRAPAGYVLDNDLSRRLSDPARLGRVVRPVGTANWLAVPMRVGGQPMGRLWMQRNGGLGFSAAERQMLALVGNQLALALENARMCQEVRHLAERRGALLRRLIELREDRSRSLARELHDEISQSLTAMQLDLDTAWAANPDAAVALAPQLDRLQTGLARVSDEIQRIILDLRPSLLEDHGLLSALRWYARERFRRSATVVQISPENQPERLYLPVETALYRIGQEALSNAARHAQANHVNLHLACDQGQCTLTVEDDGRGFDVQLVLDRPQGMQAVGLIGMQERAELTGGRVVVESSPGVGTLITATVPRRDSHDEKRSYPAG